jgi:hypothetical protein
MLLPAMRQYPLRLRVASVTSSRAMPRASRWRRRARGRFPCFQEHRLPRRLRPWSHATTSA